MIKLKRSRIFSLLILHFFHLHISKDWLCEISYNKQIITSMDNIIDLLFELFKTNEFGFDVEIHRRAE